MNTHLKLVLLLLGLFGLAACNTTKGFGQDVEATGDAIENTAEDVQDDMNDDDD
jgi:predicted small secreted protein